MDQNKYDQVVDSCALKSDFEILTGGDMTEIGEKVYSANQGLNFCIWFYLSSFVYPCFQGGRNVVIILFKFKKNLIWHEKWNELPPFWH